MLHNKCNIAEGGIIAYMLVTCKVRVTLLVTISYIAVTFRLHYCVLLGNDLFLHFQTLELCVGVS